MVVYIDVLVCLNLFVDYFLLLSVSRFCSARTPNWRMLVAALSGALTSLVIFLPNLPVFLDLLLQLTMAAGIVLAAFGFGGLKRFLRLCGVFFGMTFAYGGIMMGLWLLLRPQGMVINNGIVYFDISPPLLIVATLISYGIISLIRRFHHSAPAGEQLFRITVSLDKRQVECGALLDTGNTLRDLFTDTPVVVMDFDACQSLLPAPIRPVFAGMCDPPPSIPVEGFRLIPYSAVGGKGLLPAFSPDYVEISSGRKKQRYDKVYVAVSKEELSDHYEALIGSQLWRS